MSEKRYKLKKTAPEGLFPVQNVSETEYNNLNPQDREHYEDADGPNDLNVYQPHSYETAHDGTKSGGRLADKDAAAFPLDDKGQPVPTENIVGKDPADQEKPKNPDGTAVGYTDGEKAPDSADTQAETEAHTVQTGANVTGEGEHKTGEYTGAGNE